MHWLMTTLAKYEERMERRQVRHFLMGAVFAALAVAGQAQVAAAQGVRIVSNTTGRCLDLPDGNSTNGTRLRMIDCSQSSPNQVFEAVQTSLRMRGKCVDAVGGQLRQGDVVAIWDCNGAPNQVWTLGSDGAYRLWTTNLCLDVEGDNRGNGAPLIVWNCHGGPNQSFRSEFVPSAATAGTAPPVVAQPATGVEVFDLGRLRNDMLASLANATPLANAAPLANATPLANAAPLANASPFTMPMGNNFTMPYPNGRTTQSVAQNTAGLLHVMGARTARELSCLYVAFNTAVVTQPGGCAQRPEVGLWVFGADQRIRQLDPATGRPSDRCLTLGPPRGTTPPLAVVAPCAQAVLWMANPTVPDALSPLGNSSQALGLSYGNVFLANVNGGPIARWSLLPIPKTTR